MMSFKGAQFLKDLLLTCVRWSVASPVRYRQVEELMQERGVSVDHATIKRWGLQYSPELEAAFHRRTRLVRSSWRMDETYLKVKGRWCSLYGAVDKAGQTIDFLLTQQRDEQAATRFLPTAMRRHGVPAMLTIDGSGANAAAIRGANARPGTASSIRQVTSLTTVVAQDHRAVQRVTRPMLGFTSCAAARWPRAGVERRPLVKQGHLVGEEGVEGRTPAEPFDAVAASAPAPQGGRQRTV